MQTHRQTTFATGHIRMLILALLLVAGTAVLLLSGQIISLRNGESGETALPLDQPVILSPSGQGLDDGVTTAGGSNGTAGLRSWGLGVGFDPGLTSSETVQQLPGYGFGPTEY